ncbi:leukotriene B4 receptor 1-like [Callorhinchus milii]|uniref:leukotriene B4 receptor 1-like n=1 Tax=Callorhinchus milii TaxID=7868 RepID=UPI001C3FAE9A|nr:leukotriene B4 receptor 1-like [Callorhinchus milii]
MPANMSSGLNTTHHTDVAVRTAIACVYGFIFLVGATGNSVVIWNIFMNIKHRSPTVSLILNLAVADLMALVSVPFFASDIANAPFLGLVFWKISGYLLFSSMYTSVFLITVMSIERFVAVLYPITAQKWWQRGHVGKVVTAVWLSGFLFAIPVILVVAADIRDGRPRLKRRYSSDQQQITVLLLETLIGFVIPFITLMVCYTFIFKRVKLMNFQTRDKGKTGRLIAGVVILFALCWLPYHTRNVIKVSSVLNKTSNPEYSKRLKSIESYISMLSKVLTFVSNTANPVLYAFAARSFKSGFKMSSIARLFEQMNNSSKEKNETSEIPA